MIAGLERYIASLLRGARDGRRFLVALKRLRPYLKPHLPKIAIACTAAFGYVVVTLLEPWPVQFLVDGVLLHRKIHFLGMHIHHLHTTGDPTRFLLVSVVLVVVLAALRGQLYYVQNVATATAGQDVVMELRREVFEHLQTLSIGYHRRGQLGDMLMRLTGDIVMLRDMVVSAMISVLSHTLVVVGVLAIMASINLRLMLVALATAPLLFVILSIYRGRLIEAAREQRRREGRLVSSLQEVIQSIHLVQSNTAEDYERERFRSMNQKSLNAGIRSTRLEAQLHRAVQVVLAIGAAATLGLGSWDVLQNRLSPGELLVFLAYVRGLYGPLRQVSKVVQRTAKASACADRVLEVLEERPEIASPPGAKTFGALEGRLTFRNVTFGYEPSTPVLRGLDLEIAPCATLAVVGPTGTGKTTLLNLIPRFFDPQEGEVLVDSRPVRELSLPWLRRQISYLAQETVVMGVSVRENIAYGAIGGRGAIPSSEEIEAAARAAHAHEFIMALPNGYDTLVGERGATLSGGQRQRVAIARAFLRDARILLFDEPMTGLDPVSERSVRQAFIALSRGRTTVVVAHQLSTVLHADRIAFLQRGELVELGNHEELIALDGRYAAFCRAHWSEPLREAESWGASPLPGRVPF